MRTEYAKAQNGIILPTYIIKQTKRPTCFSFFAGCGGMDLGFLQAGYEIIGANEWEPTAAITYMLNLGSYPINIHYIEGDADKERLNKACERSLIRHKDPKEILKMPVSGSGWISHQPDIPPVRHFWFGDVRKLKGQDILDALGIKQGDLDCVCGGPPCQGFSRSGKQQITDSRNPLVYEYARMIIELQPKAFVMEEVPDIVDFMDPDGVPVIDKFCMLLEEGGFGKYEALRKGIELQTGNIGLVRQRGTIGKAKRPIRTRKKSQEPTNTASQLSMF